MHLSILPLLLGLLIRHCAALNLKCRGPEALKGYSNMFTLCSGVFPWTPPKAKTDKRGTQMSLQNSCLSVSVTFWSLAWLIQAVSYILFLKKVQMVLLKVSPLSSIRMVSTRSLSTRPRGSGGYRMSCCGGRKICNLIASLAVGWLEIRWFIS